MPPAFFFSLRIALLHGSWQWFFEYDTKSTNRKGRNKQERLHQAEVLLCSKRNNQQNEKATNGMGENNKGLIPKLYKQLIQLSQK